MKCLKCGTENNQDSRFCVGCGNDLAVQNQQQPMNQPVINQNNMMNQSQVIQPMNLNNVKAFNLFEFLIKGFIKPTKTVEENDNEIKDTKNSLLLATISTILALVLALINSIIAEVHTVDYFGGGHTWDWSQLNNLEWAKVIGTNLLLYAGIIFGIALVFYLAGLVVKKEVNYLKLLAITALSILPIIIGTYIIGPLLGMINYKLEIGIFIIAMCYSIVLLSTLVNNEIGLEKDKKIYFNFICFAIIFVIIFFVIYQITIGSALDTLSSYSSYLGF